jgi:putative NIF3 family GTP cyclohydrolase 1 type 2
MFDRLTQRDTKDRIIISCIENKIAIYSPHTALDSVSGGINDWLIGCFPKENVAKSKPIQPYYNPFGDLAVATSQICKLVAFVPSDKADSIQEQLSKIDGVGKVGETNCTFGSPVKASKFLITFLISIAVGVKGHQNIVDQLRLEAVIPKGKVEEVSKLLKSFASDSVFWDIYPLESLPVENTGVGRLVTFKEALPLPTVIASVKKFLGLSSLRLATPENQDPSKISIKTVGICAGSGTFHQLLVIVYRWFCVGKPFC